jgi:hypothetical protein
MALHAGMWHIRTTVSDSAHVANRQLGLMNSSAALEDTVPTVSMVLTGRPKNLKVARG